MTALIEYMGLLAPDGTLLEANRASLEFAGNTREDVIGKPFWDTPWFTSTPGAPEFVRQGVSLAAAGEFVRYEATLRRPSGEWTTFDISLHPVRNEHGEVVLIVPEGRDVTELKILERRDAFLVRLDDTTRPLTDPNEITQTAARMLGEYLQVNRCAYAGVEQDQDAFHVSGEFNQGVSSAVGRYTFAQFGEECRRLMRAGKACVVEDSEADPLVQAAVEAYRLTSIRSMICVPLLKADRVVAIMAVHQNTPRVWRPEEVELVRLVANRCWESWSAHMSRENYGNASSASVFSPKVFPRWSGRRRLMECWITSTPRDLRISEFRKKLCSEPGGWHGFIRKNREQPEHWKRSVDTGEPYETAFRLKRGSDASWRWHLARALPLFGDNGNLAQWFGTCTDIEDQKQADANLHQQWRTFDTALSHTPDFIYTFDLDGRFTYVNRALLALWQKSLEEARGKNFFELDYPPELAARLQLQIQQVIDTKQLVRDQTPYTGAVGETGYYDYIFVPVLDARGRVRAVAGSTRDITEQSQAARQIEDDRRRWRELLAQTPAAIAVLRGPEHTFQWLNPAYARLVGRPAESVLGKTVHEAFPEVEGQVYVDLLDGVYRTGKPFVGHEVPLHLEGSDGPRNLYLNFLYAATRDVDGEIDGVFAHIIDVTDMVESRQRIEQSERQFRTLAETIPHLAWMADEKGDRLWFNRRWFDYTGSKLEEMQGRGWEKAHDPNVLPEVQKLWQQAVSSGEPFEMVYPLRSAQGEFRTFLTRVQPVKDHQGQVVRWFGTNTDITDQRRTEEDLRRMNRELEEFAYVASHDLQEPLRMVNIYTQLILKTLGTDNEALNLYAGFIQQGVMRMDALIHDLLTFSRSVHSEELPIIGTADLDASLSEALSIMKNRIEETGAVVQSSPLPSVRGDTAQMAHVFQNVLSNALKYRKKGETPEIQITAVREYDNWIISVRDNGIGFEPQYSERIFGLFKRLHKAEYPGTGLGLAICKRIVERYGGRMWAEGVPGEGSAFHFSLPLVEEQ